MEPKIKRIVAIVLIVAIGAGIGVGAWYFLIEEEATNPYWSISPSPLVS